MPTKETHYQILELSNNLVTTDEIRDAYKLLALRWHPDKVTQEQQTVATERFQQIQTAYEILSNPESRAVYDESINPFLNRTVTPPFFRKTKQKVPTSAYYLFESQSAAHAAPIPPSNIPTQIYVYNGGNLVALPSLIRAYWIDPLTLLQMETSPQGYIHIQTNDEASLKTIFRILIRQGYDFKEIIPNTASSDASQVNLTMQKK